MTARGREVDRYGARIVRGEDHWFRDRRVVGTVTDSIILAYGLDEFLAPSQRSQRLIESSHLFPP